MDRKPWQCHPDLSEERLVLVARVLMEVRADAVRDHMPEKGEGPWSLGCAAYERSLAALEAKSREWPWLGIVTRAGLYFVFSIGTAPVRFYVGDHDENPESRRYRCYESEFRQLELAFEELGEPSPGSVYRIILEKSPNGTAVGAYFAEFEPNGAAATSWLIPTGDAQIVTGTVVDIRKPGVELPAPVVGDRPAVRQENRNPSANAADEKN
jgi:hypothetical protein